MLNQGIQSGPDPRDNKKYYYAETPFRRMVTGLARLIFSGLMKVEARGLELLPSSGAVVLAANHVSNFDVFPMQLVLPRPIFFMAQAELHQNLLMDAALRQLGSFPVLRGVRDEWAIAHAARILGHGQVLGIFPEGKRTRGIGLRPAKTGAARLALTANCPIQPLAVSGTQYLFKSFPRRTTIQITLGTPILPGESDTTLSLTDRVMFSLAELLPGRLRGVYSHKPDWI